MTAYLVEMMEGDAAVAGVTVAATTPVRAAKKATAQKVTGKTQRDRWIRVTPPAGPPLEFGYAPQPNSAHRVPH